jgi:tRNA1Val (adenine37-N6)-methyltransferase
VLLAWFGRPCGAERVLDLGTGCGIIPLIMAHREAASEFWGVDNQPRLAAVAAWNVARNRLAPRVRIRCRDLRTLAPGMLGGPFDRVVSNPPFRKARSGRINPDGERARARHEITANHLDVAAAASRMLRRGGRFTTIYPAERLVDVLCAMRAQRLEPKWVRGVQPKPGAGIRLVLVEGVKEGGAALRFDDPFCIYRRDGSYTEAMARMFRP